MNPDKLKDDEHPAVEVIIPARNEAAAIGTVVGGVREHLPDAGIIVVDDGSTDNTAKIAAEAGATVIRHPYSMGNGASVKSGARAAQAPIVVFMDGDGQHDPADIGKLLKALNSGYDMVVGARSFSTQASLGRGVANHFYNRLASWMVNQTVADLTSGFRAVRRRKFLSYLHLLPNGFSYPTTITMSFFRAGLGVGYVPIKAATRVGKSHIRLVQDGIRFLLIILRIGTLYSPIKLFLPVSLGFFILGSGYYCYTLLEYGRFANMSALMLSSAMISFLIGIVSEQITALHYKDSDPVD